MSTITRFFEISLEMLATIDEQGYFIDVNPAWTRTLGYELAELRALPFIEFVHPDDRERSLKEAARLIAGGETVSFENRYRHKNGEYRWIWWNVASHRDERLLYCCARDVTTLKTSLAQLEQAQVQSKQYEAELSRVAEELRQRVQVQREAIQMMSTPIIQVWDDILTIPIIGLVDSARAADMKNAILSRVSETGARYAIIDLTGVDVVDTSTADHLLRVMQAVGLLGARCIMTGIRPAVAQSMVSLGLGMSSVTTLSSLRDGLKYCMREMANA